MAKKDNGLTIPLSNATTLILLCLQRPSHGYEIMKYVEERTDGLVSIGPATMYRSLAEFIEQGLISLLTTEGKRKKYLITPKGRQLLEQQKDFLRLLNKISEERRDDES